MEHGLRADRDRPAAETAQDREGVLPTREQVLELLQRSAYVVRASVNTRKQQSSEARNCPDRGYVLGLVYRYENATGVAARSVRGGA